jgi:uncharacterized YigZ family protein
MSTPTSYRTLSIASEGLYKDKGSKFIAYAHPVKDLEEIKQILEQIRELHPKARHVCYAYRLGFSPEEARSNDDGEPSGSAGKPILNTILSHQLHYCLVAVVRYFGGTLLGVPGLIQAYKEASLDALNIENFCTLEPEKLVEISIEYAQLNDLMKIIKKYPVRIVKQEINNLCTFELAFKLADEECVLPLLSPFINL